MKHKVFSYCATQGYRPYMEDRMHYMYDPNNNLSIFGIFDGHGGMVSFLKDVLLPNIKRFYYSIVTIALKINNFP